MSDPVYRPSHYIREDGKECIDQIREDLTPEEFRGYCKGNIIKYEWRQGKKAGTDDKAKAEVYRRWLTESQTCNDQKQD